MSKKLTYTIHTIIIAIVLALGCLTIKLLEINWCDPIYLTITIVLWVCILCVLDLISHGALDVNKPYICKKDIPWQHSHQSIT